jgi:gentisate 1,2-dioxygenase
MSLAIDASAGQPYAELIQSLGAVRSQPLWDRYHRITTRQPQSTAAAHLWPWATMAPLIDVAAREVSMEDAERRVLLFSRPDRADSVATLRSLSGGLQTLLPGEVARAHRHSLAALRFVMEGQGAVTKVNGESCLMEEGDLVLTPSLAWHEHTHPGNGRMVWFDGLDLPLLHHLDTMFFELFSRELAQVNPAATRPCLAPWNHAVLAPDACDGGGRFRYGAQRALKALEDAGPKSDGSRWLRYADASGNGPALPTLDCYLASLKHGQPTSPSRSTASAICVVASGAGQSTVGNAQFNWQRNDVFTVPHWQWATHTAASDAHLFFMTDREFLGGMGYLREEETSL